MATKLSAHFTLEELTFSDTAVRKGIDNTPDAEVVECLEITAGYLEEVRSALDDSPMNINSGYRSPALNAEVGGSSTSAHMTGFAVDFTCPSFGSPVEVCRAIVEAGIEFDQLIEEGTWVHASFDPRMRGQVKTATFEGGKAAYTDGLKG